MKVFSEKDVDGFVSFFTPDATLMFPGSDFISGKDGTVVNSSSTLQTLYFIIQLCFEEYQYRLYVHIQPTTLSLYILFLSPYNSF